MKSGTGSNIRKEIQANWTKSTYSGTVSASKHIPLWDIKDIDPDTISSDDEDGNLRRPGDYYRDKDFLDQDDEIQIVPRQVLSSKLHF